MPLKLLNFERIVVIVSAQHCGHVEGSQTVNFVINSRAESMMSVSMGILCERCRTVYLISRSHKPTRVHYDRMRGEFKLSCDPPCGAVIYFHRTMLRPYFVPTDAVERGYANVSECQLMSM
jgi:hypothetical protein